MKQEKAVLAPVDGMVLRVLKTADYRETRQMVSVRENELIVELGPIPRICSNEACARPMTLEGTAFCPYCGDALHD
jgi:pyruvate carboxylase